MRHQLQVLQRTRPRQLRLAPADRWLWVGLAMKGSDGAVREEVYRAGTPDGAVLAGLYAVYMKKAIGYLEKARGVADSAQAKVIGESYQQGPARR